MLVNSPQWMQHYLDCENLMVENINVFNHVHKNNDGIDIDGCRNVYVRNSRFDSDDDAICLKSNGPSACENVLVENCIAASHCNALKLGTETTGGFKNIIYRNCKVVQSVTGFHKIYGEETSQSAITLIITDGGKMENVWFDSIEETDCVTPIFVTLGNRSRKYTSTAPVPAIGSMKNIRISNIKASGAGPRSSSITGLDNSNRVNNITLENISIELTRPGNPEDRNIDMTKLLAEKKRAYPSPDTFGNLSSYGFNFKYINGLKIENIKFDLKCQDPREAIIFEDCQNIDKTNK
jgi:polygalacturonase